MIGPHRLGVVGLLAVTCLAAPARAEVEDGRENASEIASFKATLERYTERMTDFRKEAKNIVDAQEALARQSLDGSFEAALSELEDTTEGLRAEAVKRFEAFLLKYPDSSYTPHVMFRLGDLYYEESEEAYAISELEYSKQISALGAGDLAAAPEAPAKDYQRSIALYERIVRDYPAYQYADGAYYMLGYCFSRDDAEQYDDERSREMFQTLVDRYPSSQFASVAHLRLGEYYFDYNKLDEAMAHYQKVVELQGKTGSLYDEGLYKLAWSNYKKANYDATLKLLTELLDWSSDQMLQTGRESAMAPEAIEYSAITFSDLGDRTARRPVDVATEFYAAAGGRPYEDRVFKRLANVLTQQARYEDAIAVYKTIQQRWPEDPSNPDYQWEIGKLYMSMVPQNAAAAQDAVTALNDLYNDDSAWWRANRNNPAALDAARGYIERSLAAVATSYHTQALESNDPALFKKAAEMYGEYLTKFPFADDYYEIQWYLADTLVKSGQLEAAEREFEQLLKASNHAYKDGSLWLLMQVRRQRLIDQYGSFDALPAGAAEESKFTAASGKVRPIYALSAQHKEFIEVCDQLQQAQFTDPDYNQALTEYRAALAYLPAQILFWHGRYDEARPRLETVITTWPERDEAAFAASLVVRSYQEEDDYANVRLYAGKYRSRNLGASTDAQAANRQFADIQEGAAFKMAESFVSAGKRLEAAEAYEQFMRDFPKSRYIKDAHFNAANSYEILGRVEDANRLFEQYIQNIEKGVYQKDERAAALYFRIASNYANVLDLDKAVTYYEALGKRFPDYPDAAGAMYNAAFLRIGKGDYAGAARGLESYGTTFEKEPDAEEVFFAAGEQWKRVGDTQAADFYARYLKRYRDLNPDHVMEAHHELALIAEKSGNARQIDAAWRELAGAYARLAPTGKVGATGRHYASRAEFREIEKDFAVFKDIKFTKNDDKNAELLLTTKLNQLTGLQDRCLALVQNFQDFEYSSGALYYQGLAFYTYADMLYNAPPPAGFDEEQLGFYQEALDAKRLPVEEKGRARLEAALTLAKTEKRWTTWQSAAVAELNRRLPLEYAREKTEVQVEGDSAYVPSVGPVSLREKKDRPKEGN
jgi:cellulose synthase operon protein C